eukprot:scaffold149_cov315-Pinguiococcus_pyrenoidosus.AAC.1
MRSGGGRDPGEVPTDVAVSQYQLFPASATRSGASRRPRGSLISGGIEEIHLPSRNFPWISMTTNDISSIVI